MANGTTTEMEIEKTTSGGVSLADGDITGALESLGEADLLSARRVEAWKRFLELPLPTRQSEEWRYTDLGGLKLDELTALVPNADGDGTGSRAADGIGDLEAVPEPVREVLARARERSAVSVSVDGRTVYSRLDEELAARGVIYAPISELAATDPELLGRYLFAARVSEAEEKLWAAHVALLTDGYMLFVPRGVSVDAPIHTVRYLGAEGVLLASHSLIVTEEGAEVTCIDEFVSPDIERTSVSLTGAELLSGSNATLRYLSLQRYGRGVKHFALQHATAGRDSRLSGINISLGADLARADVTSHLEGTGSESEMLALWFGDGAQHFDHHTLQHHASPHARSDLLYKGALTDSAQSVFRGLIRVDEGAQLTDAYQTNRNLILSEEASARTLPNLEIEADDVRCSHGATVGQVDPAQLFYLMSRGLTRAQAERLLVFGFFDEVLGRVPVEGVRQRIRESIADKIGFREVGSGR